MAEPGGCRILHLICRVFYCGNRKNKLARMKLMRSIIATVIVTLSAFTAVFYTSCTKNKCTNTTCQNGGSCSNGFCICPTGYSGDNCEIPATTTIQYFNRTATPITLTLNHYSYTIPSGQSKGFTGVYGDTLLGNASTQGTYGERITWDTVNNVYPINGTTQVYFDVPSSYFYLVVDNDSLSSRIKEIIVNQGLSSERDITLPAPYLGYQAPAYLGYFYAEPTSSVYIKTASLLYYWDYTNSTSVTTNTFVLPMTQDQEIIIYPN